MIVVRDIFGDGRYHAWHTDGRGKPVTAADPWVAAYFALAFYRAARGGAM